MPIPGPLAFAPRTRFRSREVRSFRFAVVLPLYLRKPGPQSCAHNEANRILGCAVVGSVLPPSVFMLKLMHLSHESWPLRLQGTSLNAASLGGGLGEPLLSCLMDFGWVSGGNVTRKKHPRISHQSASNDSNGRIAKALITFVS